MPPTHEHGSPRQRDSPRQIAAAAWSGASSRTTTRRSLGSQPEPVRREPGIDDEPTVESLPGAGRGFSLRGFAAPPLDPPLDPARHTADDIVTTASPDDIVTRVCRVTRVPRLSSEQYAVPYAVPYAVLFTELAGVAPVQPALFRIGFDVRRACSNPQHASGPRSGELHHAGSGVCRGRSACGAAQPAGAGGSAGLTT